MPVTSGQHVSLMSFYFSSQKCVHLSDLKHRFPLVWMDLKFLNHLQQERAEVHGGQQLWTSHITIHS